MAESAIGSHLAAPPDRAESADGGARGRDGRHSAYRLTDDAGGDDADRFDSDEVRGRGSLNIQDSVYTKIAAQAATEVDGVGPQASGGVTQLLGRGLPRASVERGGSHARVDTEVPLRWPSPAAGVAAAVREHVGERVSTLTGSTVDRVNVTFPDTVTEGGVVRGGGSVTPGRAKVPTGAPAAVVVGFVLALVLVAVGFFAVWDVLIHTGALGGTPWLPRAARSVAGLKKTSAMLLISILAVLVGIILLILALRRRSRPKLTLVADIPVFLDPRDAARIAAGAADDVDGVLEARATATRTKVNLSVRVTGEDQSIADAVTEEATRALTPVQSRIGSSSPTVVTKMRSSS